MNHITDLSIAFAIYRCNARNDESSQMELTNQTTSKPEATDKIENIINAAERLFRQTGFRKTTVADIARELQMSSANVYRFFTSRSEIDAAVCRRLLDKMEVTIGKEIAESKGPASTTLSNVIFAVNHMNALRFKAHCKLHELFETAHYENWPIAREHCNWIDERFEQIIVEGMAAGEFRFGDAKLASILFRTICLKFCDPRLTVEKPRPTINQVVDFCLAALADKKGAETKYEVDGNENGSGSARAGHSGASASVGGSLKSEAKTVSRDKTRASDMASVMIRRARPCSMAAPLLVVELTIGGENLTKLMAIARSRTEPASRVERARMLLAYRDNPSFFAVGRLIGVYHQTVQRCIERAAALDPLMAFCDSARPGKAATITPEAKARLVALACQKATDIGYPHELWTTRLVAQHARAHGPSAGHECLAQGIHWTACQILDAHAVKPHKIRSCLERRDLEFDEKRAQVLCDN